MLTTALQLAAALSNATGYAWGAVDAGRVSLTLPNGWECSVWTDTDSTTATATALRFVSTYSNR
jgi:hypothetical protein